MNYIIEALLVGIYTWFLYMLFSPFIKNLYALLLVVGFSKHFLGSSFNIHRWYCNNGEACLKVLSQDQYYKANTLYLIRDSMLESIAFLFIGFILSSQLTNSILFIGIGIIIHIIAEKMLIHKHFCKTSCDIEQSN